MKDTAGSLPASVAETDLRQDPAHPFGLASGASIGREGPTVQVGAAILLQAGKLGRMVGERGLILAGSAAGVAAAFNTPLAGIVFAIEEMGRAFEQRNAGLVLIAVILAGLASLGLVGNYSYFGSNASMLLVTIDWVALVICGVTGGVCGALFAKLVLRRLIPAAQMGIRRPEKPHPDSGRLPAGWRWRFAG